MTVRILILGGTILWIIACGEAAGTESPSNPHFPQLREAQASFMEADLKGKLVLEGDCIRVTNETDTSYLPIWPQHFKLSVNDRGIRISDNSGASLFVGEEIKIGGGTSKPAFVRTLVEQPFPNDCLGPYWIVGEILRPLER